MLAAMPWVHTKLCFLILLCILPQAQSAMAEEEEEKKVCRRPAAPAIIDGRSARKQQMLDMRKTVETFVGDNLIYRDCLGEQHKKLGDTTREQNLKAVIEEAIIDSLQMDDLVADTFNTQLRLYKSLQE